MKIEYRQKSIFCFNMNHVRINSCFLLCYCVKNGITEWHIFWRAWQSFAFKKVVPVNLSLFIEL